MGSYQQFGMRLGAYGLAGRHHSSPVGRMLLTVAFIAAVCVIAIVVGAASVQ